MNDGVLVRELRARIEKTLDEHRAALHDCVDGLTEEEARRSLVPSRTTLLGLVKHVTYVEGFYFDHSITGRTLQQIGIASTPDRSFVLAEDDTIASIQAAHRRACEESRKAVARLDFDEVVTGRVEQPVWSIHLRALRDLTHHNGHADILREQVIAARTTSGGAPPG